MRSAGQVLHSALNRHGNVARSIRSGSVPRRSGRRKCAFPACRPPPAPRRPGGGSPSAVHRAPRGHSGKACAAHGSWLKIVGRRGVGSDPAPAGAAGAYLSASRPTPADGTRRTARHRPPHPPPHRAPALLSGAGQALGATREPRVRLPRPRRRTAPLRPGAAHRREGRGNRTPTDGLSQKVKGHSHAFHAALAPAGDREGRTGTQGSTGGARRYPRASGTITGVCRGIARSAPLRHAARPRPAGLTRRTVGRGSAPTRRTLEVEPVEEAPHRCSLRPQSPPHPRLPH